LQLCDVEFSFNETQLVTTFLEKTLRLK